MAKKNKFERLIDLIHKGKTRAIRTVAAIQIGHLQKEFSYDLSYILFKLYPLFLDNDFECRRAAGIALENLIPLSRPNFQSWNVNRPFMKLKSFNLEDIIQKCEPLLRGTSTSIPSFHVDEESRLSELCQISEDMIPKLTSQRWEFRHGAVQCLLRSIQSHVPSDYLEDLSVRVFTLLALDRFKDFSGDMVVFPVVEPASHLLARCLMQNVQSGLDILEQFRLRKSTDDWGLRQSFWIVVHHMLKVDKNCIDPNWLQPRLFEAFSEAGDADEVTAAALKAVMKILPYFSQIDQITSGIWELLINSEDIDPYNYPCLKALKVIIEKCQFSEFIDEDTFSIVTHCQYPSIATRRASYLLLESLFSLKDHEVYEDFDFHQYTLQLFNCSLNERDKEIYSLSIHVINKYQELMRYRGIYFDSTFAVKVCDYLAEDIQKLPNIMPLLIELAHYLEVNDEHPVFKNCKSIWSVAFIIILCLHNDTSTPIFDGIKPNIFSKDPLRLLLSLFTLKTSEIIEDKFLISTSKLFSSIRLFVCKYVGRYLKESESDSEISQLILRNVMNEQSIYDNFKDSDHYSELIKTIKSDPIIITSKLISINAVYKPPQNLLSIHSLLQFYYCVESKMKIPNNYLYMLIDTMQNAERYFGSFSAFIANRYCQMENYSQFLTLFVLFIQDNTHKLSASCIEFIDLLLTNFDVKSDKLLKWASFFVETCMYNIANQEDYIRRMASHSLAQIVKLLPLDDGDLSIFPDNLHNAKIKSMKYLKPLFDISQAPKCILNPLPNFESIPNGKIKDYQVNGINWLWFLYQYGLNGILADDMGLGKTFQCLSVISNAHTKENFETNSNSAFSIIVCPSSIIHHWASETQQFYPQINVNPIYSKTELNVQNFHMMNGLLIISYQNVRNLIPIIRQRKFVYCVLDEGHIIKNKSTKVSEAVVQIIAQHRLILTGTPIQNNVTELWTLMDFLMPGFLGTKEEFQTKYQRPIKKMFKPEATELETELGQQILTSLHNQVLPFIMRRLKINVMSELPPKVIYDEVFKMTDKQREVLQSIRSKHAINSDDEINEHTFVKMKKERKLCIHPCLVDPSIPHLLEYSAKLKELKSLLLSRLGFGGGKTSMRNRVLIFTQSTQTIEITVEILLSKIEGLTYTILDGNVAERDRHKIIDNFNKEDGPDILLLTTSVGGLGLNLQVANIVIFMENSWNFTDDDQAIARAHRMGQTKQVTVFNLITDETIESRILETQKQKRKVAQAIINDENEDVQGNAGEIFKDDEIEIKKPANEKRLTMAQIANMQQQDEDPNQYKEDYRQQDEMWKRY